MNTIDMEKDKKYENRISINTFKIIASFIPSKQNVFAHSARKGIKDLTLFKYSLKDNTESKINACDGYGWTFLHYAAARDNTKAIKLIVEKGGNINATNKNGETPIFIAVILEHKKALETLLSLGANVDLRNKEGDHLLYLAEKIGNTEINELLHLKEWKQQVDIYKNPIFQAEYDRYINKIIKESENHYLKL